MHQRMIPPDLPRLTWKMIQERYPNAWVLVIDAELDDSLHLVSGIVLAHAPDKQQLYQQASDYNFTDTFSTIEFTGNLVPETWKVVVSVLKEHPNTI